MCHSSGAAFVCCSGRGVGGLLGAAPRAVLHEALTTGGALGAGVREEADRGLGPWSEDAAVAYQLLLQVRDIYGDNSEDLTTVVTSSLPGWGADQRGAVV